MILLFILERYQVLPESFIHSPFRESAKNSKTGNMWKKFGKPNFFST